MRLYVEDDADSRLLLLLTQPTTVAQVKQNIEQRQGVPAAQQALLFAGRDLPDGALVEEELGLGDYNTRQEATLHLRRRLAAPCSVWLAGGGGCNSACGGGGAAPVARRHQQHLEEVEAGASMRDIMDLLAVRGLAAVPFAGDSAGSSNVVVRRQDGSAPRLVPPVTGATTVAGLEAALAAAEGTSPTSITFLQAPDGCLHAICGPSQARNASTLTIYSRSLLPQPPMPVKQPWAGQEQLAALSRRLCVNP